MKIYAQIYEYYDCALCGDDCLRKYHTEHRFEPWEDHGPDDHIRYCICVEARETAEHNFVKQSIVWICFGLWFFDMTTISANTLTVLERVTLVYRIFYTTYEGEPEKEAEPSEKSE